MGLAIIIINEQGQWALSVPWTVVGGKTDKLAFKTIPPNAYGQITLNSEKERINKEGHLWLRNIGNQTDSDDATWVWVNPTILAIRWLPI